MNELVLIPIIGFLCLVLLLANRAQGSPRLRPLLYLTLLGINVGLIVVFGLVLVAAAVPDSKIDLANAQAGLVGAVIFAILATLPLLTPVRYGLVRIFPRKETGGFDPDSIIHMTAMIFVVYLLANTILGYLVAGGLKGLAENYTPNTLVDVLETLAIWIVIAAFGGGLLTHRSIPALLQRLGLRWPTIEELVIGALMAAALVVFQFVVGVVWQAITPPDVFDQQNRLSQLIAGDVNTIMLALIIAASAAIGEEIAFRGALQPIFGLWPTAVVFVMTHIQYTLTPAALLILGVALGLGWLRRHYNTTTSMVAHFLYDFTLLVLSVYLTYFQNVVGGPLK